MTIATAQFDWQSAERKAFNYLQKKLGGLENVQAFCPEFPLTINDSSVDLKQWRFEVSGGENVNFTQPSQRGQLTSWWMNAMFEGRFVNRSLGQKVAGIIKDILPAGQTGTDEDEINLLQGVQQIAYTQHPSLTRETIYLDNDNLTGGTIRIYLLSVPCWIVFENMEEYT